MIPLAFTDTYGTLNVPPALGVCAVLSPYAPGVIPESPKVTEISLEEEPLVPEIFVLSAFTPLTTVTVCELWVSVQGTVTAKSPDLSKTTA